MQIIKSISCEAGQQNTYLPSHYIKPLRSSVLPLVHMARLCSIGVNVTMEWIYIYSMLLRLASPWIQPITAGGRVSPCAAISDSGAAKLLHRLPEHGAQNDSDGGADDDSRRCGRMGDRPPHCLHHYNQRRVRTTTHVVLKSNMSQSVSIFSFAFAIRDASTFNLIIPVINLSRPKQPSHASMLRMWKVRIARGFDL